MQIKGHSKKLSVILQKCQGHGRQGNTKISILIEEYYGDKATKCHA